MHCMYNVSLDLAPLIMIYLRFQWLLVMSYHHVYFFKRKALYSISFKQIVVMKRVFTSVPYIGLSTGNNLIDMWPQFNTCKYMLWWLFKCYDHLTLANIRSLIRPFLLTYQSTTPVGYMEMIYIIKALHLIIKDYFCKTHTYIQYKICCGKSINCLNSICMILTWGTSMKKSKCT